MNRREMMTRAAATTVAASLPYSAFSAGHQGDMIATDAGEVTVFPVSHASVVLKVAGGIIYVDPVGDAGLYADLPPPDMVLITHEHGDHFNKDVLQGIGAGALPMITNPAVFGKLEGGLSGQAAALSNGQSSELLGITIDAVPAYNTTPERANFHPQGRDNGYVLTIGDFRIYVSGDTEDTDEMRALEGIDLAFVSMNLPFTMDVNQAASAVKEFRPRIVYPYHYRGRDGGTQDPAELARLVGDASQVRMAPWYG